MKIAKFSQQCLKICIFALFASLSLYTATAQEVVTSNTQGTHDGWFYSFWTENPDDGASMTLHPDGRYTTTWNNTLNFTAGKGWAVGSRNRVVCFEGSYDGGSNGFLALYGWTEDPLIEYYICEKHGDWTPPGNTSGVEEYGEYTSDGGTYKVYTGYRENKPSIVGTASFQQYWSVRQEQRSSGTITFENHVEQWESIGMDMGTTWDYQIMESEGYNSSGSSDITVWECETSDISVELTAPTAETTFDEPATITLTADASTTSGSISKVEFYNGSTKLGEDNSAPYSYTWEDVSAGTYSVTALAIDNSNETLESAAVDVRVFAPQTPYGGSPHPIPGIIEFEEFDEGGNGNAYYDTNEGSEVENGPDFRTDEDVDIENCEDTEGGYNLGYTMAGEWLEYTVDVEQSGS
ncbi:MAG: glycoside hydrolase family 11 protein, partial [Bacteroidales bacterium]